MVVPPDFEDEEEPGPWQRRLWGDPDRPYARRGCILLLTVLLVLALVLSLLTDILRIF
jgi:hypothetical protein